MGFYLGPFPWTHETCSPCEISKRHRPSRLPAVPTGGGDAQAGEAAATTPAAGRPRPPLRRPRRPHPLPLRLRPLHPPRRGFLPATFSGGPPFPYSLADYDDDAAGGNSADPIDEWDEVEDDDGWLEAAAADDEPSELYWDHAAGVARRSFGKLGYESGGSSVERGGTAFTSDDQTLDESVREQLGEIRSVEDALLLKGGHGGSKLRDGWAPWFERKGAYLRRDRMLRGNLESLNPMNNPLLKDPDLPCLTSLTRGDKIVQKAMLNEISKLPFGLDYDKQMGE